MVVMHDVLVPMRFLALLGHFLSTILAIYAVVRADGCAPFCWERAAPFLFPDTRSRAAARSGTM